MVRTGQYVELTWATNAMGVVLAAVLVAVEWLARASRARAPTAVVGADG